MYRLVIATLGVLSALCFAVPAKADTNETANTVATCRTNLNSCRDSIGLAVVFFGECTPKDMVLPTDAEVEGVLSWLEAHPQVEPDDWSAATEVALKALYPCS